MEGPLERRQEQDLIRVSDADRHRVAEILREAAGEGRIDLEELDQRLEAAYAARTYADLAPLTSDLPVAGAAQAPIPRSTPGPVVPAARHDRTVAVLGSASRTGVWEVGPTHRAFALMAGVDLDLRQARFSAPETVVHATAFWGGINVVVNEFTQVVVEGVGVMGGFDQASDKVEARLGPDSPVVRVKGVALMAGVTVQRRAVPGRPGRARLGDD